MAFGWRAILDTHGKLLKALKILLEPFSSPSSTLFEVDLTGDIDKGSYLSPGFTWSVHVMERAGVPNVLSTQLGAMYFF